PDWNPKVEGLPFLFPPFPSFSFSFSFPPPNGERHPPKQAAITVSLILLIQTFSVFIYLFSISFSCAFHLLSHSRCI
ncbi:hypothetical protein CISIN_1g0469461mg, partial [Citrus sinensis]